MIFADKLIALRKKNGWSQEELAEKINITRQSVSKWESAQSVPDLEKMVRLSELFGVSTDYLLKDEMGEPEYCEIQEETPKLRHVSMEDASRFLETKKQTSKSIAYATFLCIVSPVALILLSVMSEYGKIALHENVTAAIGMVILLLFAAAAVAIFISSGSKTSEFEYLEKEVFETQYGVTGMVKERKENYKSTYTQSNIIGTCLCILSLIPLFSALIIDSDKEFLLILMVACIFILVGIAVIFFIRAGIVWESFNKLLQEGDYTRKKKQFNNDDDSLIAKVYWPIVTVVYLVYSFAANSWAHSWIIWVAAGILYSVVVALYNSLTNRK